VSPRLLRCLPWETNQRGGENWPQALRQGPLFAAPLLHIGPYGAARRIAAAVIAVMASAMASAVILAPWAEVNRATEATPGREGRSASQAASASRSRGVHRNGPGEPTNPGTVLDRPTIGGKRKRVPRGNGNPLSIPRLSSHANETGSVGEVRRTNTRASVLLKAFRARYRCCQAADSRQSAPGW
jgi:hypothetical protein